MADLNDLNQPTLTSSANNEVLETFRGHILRLWKGDYTGMGNLVTGIRRWVQVGTTNVKLVQRNVGGTEDTLFDSSLTALKDGTNATGTWGISITGNAATATSATTAAAAPWSGITGKPFNWAGQSGQPSWLWGSNDGSNYYVWNPSNFNVNYASSAGYATNAGTAASCSGNAATATTASNAIGNGQTWQAVTRTAGVTYYNTTGKSIFLAISIEGVSGSYIKLNIDGIDSIGYASNGGGSSGALSCSAIIPNGSSYKQSGNTATNVAFELR